MLEMTEPFNLVRISCQWLGMVASYLFLHHMIGLSDSLGDYNVNCCHTYVSLLVRIYIL
jgi:hypothetical protein